MSDVTRILNAIKQGDAKATDKLLPLVYEELRNLAAHKLHHEPAGQTLQVIAVPDPGSLFSHWGVGDCDSITTMDALPVCVVNGPGVRDVRVYFE